MSPDRTALVTGSASGIGYEMAILLAQKGYQLYLVDINQEGLEKVSREIAAAYPVKVIHKGIDLSMPDAAQRVYADCCDRKLDVEVLISNAGFFFFSEIAETDPEKAARLIRLHVLTPSMLAIYFSREMKQKGRGYILMTSSVSAYRDFPGIGFYAASKTYIKSFSQSLRYEMRYYGVKVTALCPGATATNLYDPNVINVEKGKRWGIMMDARKVAAAGLNGMFHNRAVVIPGFMTKVMTAISVFLPASVIYWARVRWRNVF